jgi:hypothetical protein
MEDEGYTEFVEGITRFVATFNQSLDYIEQITKSFKEIFELEIREQASDISKKLNSVIELYYYDTVNSDESLTSAFDLDFSELDHMNRSFSQKAKNLKNSIMDLESIYKQFILSQSIVIIVSSLEVFLSGVFSYCLMKKFQQNSRAVDKITDRYNFQNWGNTVDGYQTFLNIDLGKDESFKSKIIKLQQNRHVLVRQSGIIDKRVIKTLNLPEKAIGKKLNFTEKEIKDYIETARKFSIYLQDAITDNEK